MEEAKENKDEFLRRIKILENIINFIIFLFNKRQIRIITSFGLTEPFIGEDGIDQGETISLLLWRIFYDPLLCQIQQDQELGYNIKMNWPFLIANKTIYLFLSEQQHLSIWMTRYGSLHLKIRLNILSTFSTDSSILTT